MTKAMSLAKSDLPTSVGIAALIFTAQRTPENRKLKKEKDAE